MMDPMKREMKIVMFREKIACDHDKCARRGCHHTRTQSSLFCVICIADGHATPKTSCDNLPAVGMLN